MARDIESLLRQQQALAAFGSFAFRERDLIRILEEAARICAESIGVEHSKICRYRPEENDLLIEAGYGWKPGVLGTVVSPIDETSPQGRAFVTREPVIVGDLRQRNGYTPPAFYAEHGIVSTVDVLIQANSGPPFGVLEIDSTTVKTYDDHDIIFLTGFANILAEAVATKARIEALQSALTSLESMVGEKDRLLGERNLLAMELQQRVRNNLQLINDMVNGLLRRTTEEGGRLGLQGIVRKIMSLAEVYEHLFGVGMSGQIDLGAYAEALCANLPDLQPSQGLPIVLRCNSEALEVTLASATALGLVLTELISNSYEHAFSGRGGTINVRVARGEGKDQGVITIIDDGGGYVPAAETRRRGVGLARRLMEQVEGTLDVVGAGGTAWTLRFPVMPEGAIGAAAA
jgi:two-component sensor histidine kinase